MAIIVIGCCQSPSRGVIMGSCQSSSKWCSLGTWRGKPAGRDIGAYPSSIQDLVFPLSKRCFVGMKLLNKSPSHVNVTETTFTRRNHNVNESEYRSIHRNVDVGF